jgi:hypothetical protein
MPTGGWQNVNFVLRNIAPLALTGKITPKQRVLDVGVGGGRWGFHFRDCMEWRADRYKFEDWQYVIHGIEAWPGYRNPVWDYAYNRVDIGPIQDLIGEVEKREPYDFIFFMDIIEHLPKEMGQEMLDRLLKRARKILLVSFPDGNNPHALDQGAVHGNEYERHVSRWTVDELIGKYEILDRVENNGACLKGRYDIQA